LKDNINTMINNLRLTTSGTLNKTGSRQNLARFTGMLQGQRDLSTVGRTLLSELALLVNAQQGVIYQMHNDEEAMVPLSAFADDGRQRASTKAEDREGLVGQCAQEKRRMVITDVPSNNHHYPVRLV